MRDTVAARKYAKALFLEAQSKNQLRACQQGLEEILRVSRQQRSLREVLGHPFIAVNEKERMVRTALGEYATPLLEQFCLLIIEKKRWNLLETIVEEFQELVDRSQNVQPIAVRTAAPLSETQQKNLKTQMESWLGAKVRMDVKVDPQLIGGLIVQTRDQVLDESLAGQLKRLQARLSA